MKILVADDNASTLRLLVRLLTGEGYQVDVAKDGRELVKVWKFGKHRLVISDIAMPEKDGITACQEIRGMDPKVKFILVTGSPELADKAKEARLGPCLRKQFGLSRICALVRKQARAKKASQDSLDQG